MEQSWMEAYLGIYEIANGLAYNRIAFNFDKCAAAMGTHPADILYDILCQFDKVFVHNKASGISVSDVEELYSSLQSFNESFEVEELNPIIDEFEKFVDYVKQNN